jgi:hypothetical protein
MDKSDQAQSSTPVVENGWVMVDGCKIAKVEPGGKISFRDKCRRRCSERGSTVVIVDPQEIAKIVSEGS